MAEQLTLAKLKTAMLAVRPKPKAKTGPPSRKVFGKKSPTIRGNFRKLSASMGGGIVPPTQVGDDDPPSLPGTAAGIRANAYKPPGLGGQPGLGGPPGSPQAFGASMAAPPGPTGPTAGMGGQAGRNAMIAKGGPPGGAQPPMQPPGGAEDAPSQPDPFIKNRIAMGKGPMSPGEIGAQMPTTPQSPAPPPTATSPASPAPPTPPSTPQQFGASMAEPSPSGAPEPFKPPPGPWRTSTRAPLQGDGDPPYSGVGMAVVPPEKPEPAPLTPGLPSTPSEEPSEYRQSIIERNKPKPPGFLGGLANSARSMYNEATSAPPGFRPKPAQPTGGGQSGPYAGAGGGQGGFFAEQGELKSNPDAPSAPETPPEPPEGMPGPAADPRWGQVPEDLTPDGQPYAGLPRDQANDLLSEGQLPTPQSQPPGHIEDNPGSALPKGTPSNEENWQQPGRFQHVIDDTQRMVEQNKQRLAAGNLSPKQMATAQRGIDSATSRIADLQKRQGMGQDDYKGYLATQGIPNPDQAAAKLFQPGGQADWHQQVSTNTALGKSPYAGISGQSPDASQLASQLEASRKTMGSAPAGKTELAGAPPTQSGGEQAPSGAAIAEHMQKYPYLSGWRRGETLSNPNSQLAGEFPNAAKQQQMLAGQNQPASPVAQQEPPMPTIKESAERFVGGLFKEAFMYGRTDSTVPQMNNAKPKTRLRDRFKRMFKLPLPNEPEKAAAFPRLQQLFKSPKSVGQRAIMAERPAMRSRSYGYDLTGGGYHYDYPLAGADLREVGHRAANAQAGKQMRAAGAGAAGLAGGVGLGAYGLSSPRSDKDTPMPYESPSPSSASTAEVPSPPEPSVAQRAAAGDIGPPEPSIAQRDAAGENGSVASMVPPWLMQALRQAGDYTSKNPGMVGGIAAGGLGLGGLAYLASRRRRRRDDEKQAASTFIDTMFVKRADPEDPLLHRMTSKGKLSKGSAVAIAKSRGWIRQSGKHLELNKAGRGPRNNAVKHMRQEKRSSVDQFIDGLLEKASSGMGMGGGTAAVRPSAGPRIQMAGRGGSLSRVGAAAPAAPAAPAPAAPPMPSVGIH